MTRHSRLISRHYIEYRLVIIFGAAYFFTLTVACVMFAKMMTSKFYHPLFWSWCGWTFITAWCFYMFMRTVLSPAVQIYPDMIVLSHPKSRVIRKEYLKSFQITDLTVDLSFIEDDKLQNLKINIRPKLPVLT